MEALRLEGTGRTPAVHFDAAQGVLEISGRSIPENSIAFFKPLYDWIDDYVEHPLKDTEIRINLEYFNTSSSKCILDMLRKLERLVEDGHGAIVKWFYEEEDDDMLDSGNDFKSLINMDIHLVVK